MKNFSLKPRNAVTEHQIQCGFIRWVRLASKNDWRLRLLFAVPNGGKRNSLIALKLKKEGTLPGVCDIIFPYPSGGFCGLAIEFKKPKTGKLSENQASYISLLTHAGWLVEVLTDTEIAVQKVQEYLRNDLRNDN